MFVIIIIFFFPVLSFFFSGRGKEYWEDDNIIEEMPACRQMFNIFHPFDPVAYRSLQLLLIYSLHTFIDVCGCNYMPMLTHK